MEDSSNGTLLVTRYYWFLPAIAAGFLMLLAPQPWAPILLFVNHAVYVWGARMLLAPPREGLVLSRLVGQVLFQLFFGLAAGLFVGVPLALAMPDWDLVSIAVLAASSAVFLLIALKLWPAHGSIVTDDDPQLNNPVSAAARGCRLALSLTRERLETTLEGIPVLGGALILGAAPVALYYLVAGLDPAAFFGAAAAYLCLLAPWVSWFVVSEVLRVVQIEPEAAPAEPAPPPAETQIMTPADTIAATPVFAQPQTEADPLLLAATNCDMTAMQNAVDRGANVNVTGDKAVTPIILVVQSQHADRERAIQWLVEQGADPNAADLSRNTPLHHAVHLGDLTATSTLLKWGASMLLENNEQMSPLAAACDAAQWTAAKALIDAGAAVKPDRGVSPLHAAAMQSDDDPAGIEMLLKAGAKVNQSGKLGRTALMGAALKGNAQIADTLLKAGADINARDDFGNTALMEASRSGANPVLERFVFWNPETEPRDKPGRTALLVAVSSRRSNPETIRLLIAMGADPDVRNREGREAADLAAAAGRWRVAKALGYKETATTVMSPNRLKAEPEEQADDALVIDLRRFQTNEDMEWAQRQMENRSRTQLEAATTVMAAVTASAVSPSPAPEQQESDEPPAEPSELADTGAEDEVAEPSRDESDFKLVGEVLEYPTGKSLSQDQAEADSNSLPADEPPATDEPALEAVEPVEAEPVELEPVEPLESEAAGDEAPEHAEHAEISVVDINLHQVEPEVEEPAEEEHSDGLSQVVDLGDADEAAIDQGKSGVFEDPQADEKRQAGYTALLEAATSDDIEQMKVVLMSQPDAPEWWLSSAFLNAVASGAIVAPRWLLDNGLNPNARGESGQALLDCLVQQSPAPLDIIGHLLEQGARAEPAGLHLVWLSGYACHQHDMPADKLDEDHEAALTGLIPRMIERGADPELQDRLGRTALHWAVAHRSLPYVEALLNHGFDVNARDGGGNPPLICAMDAERPQQMGILRSLIKHGADPKLANDEGSTPMALAMAADDATIQKILMMGKGQSEARKAPDQKKDDLVAAAAEGNLGRVKRLLATAADVDQRDKQGCTALLRAAGGGHPTVVTSLLAEGADAELAASNGTTPLGAAVLGDHREIVKLLVDRGVPVDQHQRFGLTPLMLSAARWNPRMTQLLIRMGAAVDHRDEMEGTALMAAVQNALVSDRREQGEQTVHALIAAGADVNAANDEGQTALMLLLGVRSRDEAREEPASLSELTRMLVEAGADLDSQDLTGWSALHAAAAHGFLNPTRDLLNAGASKRLRDINGLSACDLAMDHSHDKLVDLFLSS